MREEVENTFAKMLEEPKEIQEKLDEIAKEVDEEMEKLGFTRNGTPMRGSCHARWEIEKEILKKRYGIDWKTPQERNPNVRFD